MSNDDQLAQLKRALQAIKELRAKLESVERARTEPIAIIGLGCRFPGNANSPEAFWQLLVNSVDAITEVPRERWDSEALFDADPAAAGKTTTRWGSFLKDVDQFDAAFFGIAPREAVGMDPQQRLLLEVAWEAFEDAGQTIEQLAGSQTGVFIGLHSHSQDYYSLQTADPTQIDLYTGTGTAHNVTSGRLAYIFDLHGPNVAVDTACSSSLVAVHLAMQSLRNGECNLAVAGGVNVMLSPQFTIAASRMRMLASDGRCKTFDARADGFVRGEGCGVVVLKRLSDAITDGDPVHAVIRGSAINQDGHTNGLTAPNGLSQQAVIRAALDNAGIDPALVTYIETHGTGTPLGDPIEVEALANVLGQPADRRCYLGSVKTNVGHLEGAAGIAGLIKTVLVLKHRSIPPNLHFETLNPHIQLNGTRLDVPTAVVPWSDGDERHYAGVSSFGWSGTNAHVVLEEAPASHPIEVSASELITHYILPLSARDPEALRSFARSYRQQLKSDRAFLLDDMCYTTGVRRSHHDHRLAVVGRSGEELAQQIEAALLDDVSPGHKPPSRLPGIVFVCPGQGSQWLGMGRQLFEQVPAFRDVIERCDRAMQSLVEWSLIEQLTSPTVHLTDIAVIQPVLCAIEIALATVWRSWGIEPDAVVGHSMGEVAAACIAGALDLDDALRIICTRSRLMKRVSGQGAMAVVNLSVDQAQTAIGSYADRLSVAVSNGPQSSVLSGDPVALEIVLETLRSKNIFCRAVQVDVAAHSPHMDVLRGELVAALPMLRPHAAAIPIYSTVTGRLIRGEDLNAAYWGRNLREPVLFSAATQQLIADGATTFIELSPHPILLAAIEQGLQDRKQAGLTLPSLRREDDEQTVMLTSLGALYTRGYDVAWSRLYSHGRVVPLPAYPWQHERFWFQASTVENRPITQRSRGVKQDHPLLGWQLDLADHSGGFVWEVEVSRSALPHVYDHRLNGTAVLAASTYVEIALAAGRSTFGEQPVTLHDVSFKRALPLNDERILLQVSLSPAADGGLTLKIHSRQSDTWVLHFSAALYADANQIATQVDPLAAIRSRCEHEIAGPEVYRYLDAKGVQIGEVLKGIANVRRGNNELLAQLTVSAATRDYLVAPAILDSLFQLLGFVAEDDAMLMPVKAELVRFFAAQRENTDLWGDARLNVTDPDSPVVDLFLFDEAGHILIEIGGLRLKRFGGRGGVSDNVADWLYEVQWVARPKSESARDIVHPRESSTWLIFADRGGVGEALAAAFARQGDRSVLISADDVHQTFEHVEDFHGVMYLTGLDVPEAKSAAAFEAGQEIVCDPVLHILHDLPRREWPVPPRLWLITRNAQMAAQATNIAQAPLWGLGRVFAEEHREYWGGLIDLDPASAPADAAECIAAEVLHSDGEDQLAYRGGQRYVARLAHFHGELTALGSGQLRPDAAYLITGGLGGIGVEVARWLAQQGARRLVLMGRTPLPPRAEWDQIQDVRQQRMAQVVRELEALGVSVHYAAADVADEDQLRAFLDQYRREGWPPVRGVIHAAGVIDDRMLTQLDAESLRAVMRPKVGGGWLLHRLFEDQPLDFFALFSSVGSLLGQMGQGSYAAANAFLDALAHYRRGRGLPALSINWGAWSGLGFAATAGGQRVISHLSTQGMASFSAKQGLEALAHLLLSETPEAVVVPIDWARLRAARATAGHMWIDLIEEVSDQEQKTTSEKSLRDTWSELPPTQRRSAIEAYLQMTLAQVLRLAPSHIEPDMPFGRLGLESLMAVEFRNRLAGALDLSLSATLAWNYPTITELATYLAGKLDLELDPIGSATPAERVPSTLEVDRDVTQIEAMSDAEALQTLLSRRKGKR